MLNRRLFPASFAQQRLLFLDRLNPGSAAYNLTRVFRATGRLDANALDKALTSITQRHSSLRTRFIFESENAYQIVEDKVAFTLPTVDLGKFPDINRENRALRIARTEASKSFDLSAAPLFRVVLIRLGPTEHFLVLVMHHIITDGWSMSILFEEIGKLYSATLDGIQTDLPAPEIQYVDFARWQQEQYTPTTLARQTAYWISKLKGHRGIIDLPANYARPSSQSHDGAIETFQIGKQLNGKLTSVAEKHDATKFMVLLAALYVLLARYTGEEDIVIGTPTAGRGDLQFENVMGLFVNTLVIRGDCSDNPSFSELLRRTRATTLDAFEHQDLPFERLIEALNPPRDQRYSPLFQVMFVFHNAPRQILDLAGLRLQELEFDSGSAKFDLTIEVIEQDGVLDFSIEYCTALFEQRTIAGLSRHLETLLENITNDPDRQIANIAILDEESRNKLIYKFNSTKAEYRRNTRVEELFDQQVAKTPEQIALVEGPNAITYESLNRKANAVAIQLRELGLNQQRPVGVHIERSIDAVVAYLAALKANTPYVPLDIANPKHRLELLMHEAGCDAVLTHRKRVSELPRAYQSNIT
jgi:hypothetical protein